MISFSPLLFTFHCFFHSFPYSACWSASRTRTHAATRHPATDPSSSEPPSHAKMKRLAHLPWIYGFVCSRCASFSFVLLSFLFLFFNLIINIDSERQRLDEKQPAQLNTVITNVSGLIDLSIF